MRTLLIIAGLVSVVATGFAQLAKDPLAPGAARKVVQQTAQILKDAKIGGQAEAEKIVRERAAASPRAEQVAGEAKGAENAGAGERGLVEQGDRKLEPALREVAPEGRLLIAQSDAAPPTRAPSPDAPAVIRRTASPDAPAPVVGRTQSPDSPAGKAAGNTPGAKSADGDTRMDITSQGAVYFTSADSLAVFTEDVVLVHPQFHMTGDVLEVYLLKEEDKKKPGAPPVPVAIPVGAKPGGEAVAPPPQPDGQIKQAIAKGRKVVIQKLDENGELQIGICRHATYIGESGDIVMRDMPQVQRGVNLTIAVDPSTYMIIKQNGQFRAFGPTRTEIIQKKQPQGGKPLPPGTATVTAPKTAKP